MSSYFLPPLVLRYDCTFLHMDEKLYPTGSNALATNTDRASAFCMTPYPSTWNSLGSTPAYVLKKRRRRRGRRGKGE